MPNTSNLNNVKNLSERFKDAKSIILINYKGINVEDVSILRRRLRGANVDYFVAKNSLIKIALNELGIEDLNTYLIGTTAVAVSKEDEVAPAREIRGFINENMKDKDFPSFKVGYVNGTFFDQQRVIALAQLPAKEQIIAEVLCGLNAPISGFIYTLKGIIDGLVFVVDGIAKSEGR